MKILITGAGGRLGTALCLLMERRGIEYCGFTHKELDVTRADDVEKAINSFRPDTVFHCAAYTDVDRAETEPALAYAINANGAEHVAAAARNVGASLLYVSSDYVFSGCGTMPHRETDTPAPKNVYGESKLLGEQLAMKNNPRCFIVRTSWLFGGNKQRNFVTSILERADSGQPLFVVEDQVGSPTYTVDLASAILALTKTKRYGIYHMTNEGTCNRLAFAKEILRLAKKQADVRSIRSDEYPSRASRPLICCLDKSGMEMAGIEKLPTWQDALNRYLGELC